MVHYYKATKKESHLSFSLSLFFRVKALISFLFILFYIGIIHIANVNAQARKPIRNLPLNMFRRMHGMSRLVPSHIMGRNSSNVPDLRQVTQTGNKISLVGRWTDGDCNAVWTSGNYTYIGDGHDLDILDISNPKKPTLVSKVDLPSPAVDIMVSGKYAYVADGGAGMYIVDVSNVTQPEKLGYYKTTGYAGDLYVSGEYVYVADGQAGLCIINVSNPTNPVKTGYYDTDGNAKGITVSGHYAYIADGSNGVQIFDISNVSNATLVGSCKTNDSAESVTVSGNYVYVADLTYGLFVIDASDVNKPVEAGSYKLVNQSGTYLEAKSVAVSGNYVYLSGRSNQEGFWIFDISDPANPKKLGTYSSSDPNSSYQIFIKSNYAYIANGEQGLLLLDVSNPVSPQKVTTYSTNDFTNLMNDIYVNDGLAYVTDQDTGLTVIDVNDPTQPFKINSYHTYKGSYGAVDVQSFGNYLYVAKGDSGIYIFNKNNINKLQPIDSVSEHTDYGFLIKNNYLFTLKFESTKLYISNLNNPTQPKIVGSYQTGVKGDYIEGLVVSDNYGYAATDSGLVVLDISDPTNPHKISSLNSIKGNLVIGMTANNHYLYISEFPPDGDRLIIFDVSNPADPQQVGIDHDVDFADDIVVSGNYAYVADADDGLRVVDISNPSYPQQVDFYPLDWAGYVKLDGNYIYVTDFGEGLYIFKNNLINNTPIEKKVKIPSSYILNQNYPNPFNPTTNISYDLPRASMVVLKVYNLLGQLVATLVDKKQAPGQYTINFNAIKLSSGMYIYRLKAGNYQISKKMILLK